MSNCSTLGSLFATLSHYLGVCASTVDNLTFLPAVKITGAPALDLPVPEVEAGLDLVPVRGPEDDMEGGLDGFEGDIFHVEGAVEDGDVLDFLADALDGDFDTNSLLA